MKHYVYCITELDTNMQYIGKHSSHINDIGINYFSSSSNKSFIQNQKKNPDNYEYKILSVYDTAKIALIEESRLHYLYNVGTNVSFYNRCKSNLIGYDVTGRVVAKDMFNNIYHINCDDVRLKNGELFGITKGYFFASDKLGNKVKCCTGDIRLKTGELTFHTKYTITVKNSKGQCFRVQNTDIRYLNNELIPITKGMVSARDIDGKNHYVTVDQYYKNKDILYTSLYNKVVVKDIDGNIKVLNKDLFKYSDMKGVTAGMIWINNGEINKLIDNNDIIPDGWFKVQLRQNNIAHNNCKIAITNGKRNKYIDANDIIPDGWYKGVKPNATNTGKIWITNGIESKLISKSDSIEEGWFKGRKLK